MKWHQITYFMSKKLLTSSPPSYTLHLIQLSQLFLHHRSFLSVFFHFLFQEISFGSIQIFHFNSRTKLPIFTFSHSHDMHWKSHRKNFYCSLFLMLTTIKFIVFYFTYTFYLNIFLILWIFECGLCNIGKLCCF